ncbi:MAG: thermonuclease family protein [Ilumatobacteraceae bacterium]
MRVPRLARLVISGVLLLGCSDAGTPVPTASGGESTTYEPNATLVRVVDGDTVEVDIDGTREKVRLIGIDTPETVKPNSPVECFGPEASAFTKSLLPEGTPLLLERDVEARDDYGRLLAYVYRAADGLFVNLEIVAEGYANLLTFPPNVAHVDDFVAAARTAEAVDLGLWSACSG